LLAAVTGDGEVLVEGQYVGRLRGLKYEPDAAADLAEGRALRTAANRVLSREIARRAAKLAAAEKDAISWHDDGMLWWDGAPVATVNPGAQSLEPRVELLPFDHLDGPLRERARHHLQTWLRAHVAASLSPLQRLSDASFEGPARGLCYQLVEALGILPRAGVADLIADMSPADRAKLQRLGVRLGYRDVFLPALLRPARLSARARLWRLDNPELAHPALPEPGRVAVSLTEKGDLERYQAAVGFRPCDDIAVRVDIFDRLARLAHVAGKKGAFEASHEMLSLLGRGREGLDMVLRDLGYSGKGAIEARRYRFHHPSRKKAAQRKQGPDQQRSAGGEVTKVTAFADLRRLLRRP